MAFSKPLNLQLSTWRNSANHYTGFIENDVTVISRGLKTEIVHIQEVKIANYSTNKDGEEFGTSDTEFPV